MSTKNDGGLAFPYPEAGFVESTGMTLRDWFVGQALNGWLASFGQYETAGAEQVAEFAYATADAMLAEREK